jgi:hypothetical protein
LDASAATTFGFARALIHTRSAMSGSTFWSMSPSASEHSSLSSAIHVSRSCFLFCCNTRRASSTASNAFSLPLCKHTPKYCSSGEFCPGCAGTDWNRPIVSAVLSTPLGESAATSAAPL